MTEKNVLLPIVTPDVGFSVQADILQTEQNKYVLGILERLLKDNPCVAGFINNMITDSPKEYAKVIAYTGAVVYRLLESQAEADEMNGEFILG